LLRAPHQEERDRAERDNRERGRGEEDRAGTRTGDRRGRELHSDMTR